MFSAESHDRYPFSIFKIEYQQIYTVAYCKEEDYKRKRFPFVSTLHCELHVNRADFQHAETRQI